MQPEQPQYNTQSMHRVYYTHFYPLKCVTRALTCGLSGNNTNNNTSPQYRDLRFECVNWYDPDTHWSKKHFDRHTDELLRTHLMADLPQSIHIGQFMPLLQLDTSKWAPGDRTMGLRASQSKTNSTTTKRSLYNSGSNARFVVTNSPEYVSPLHETCGSGYAHFVTPLKELVFDIDVPGFNRFCPCVDENGDTIHNTLCDTCGLHIEGAYEMMLFILDEQLGYESRHQLYVFSGGKGIHCFINAPRAMSLNEQQRMALYDAIQLSGSGNNAGTGNGRHESGDKPLFGWIRTVATPELSKRLQRLFRTNVLDVRNLLMRPDSRFWQWALRKLQRYWPAVYNQVEPVWKAQRNNSKCHSRDMWRTLRAFEVYRDRSDVGSEWDFKGNVRPSLFLIYRLYYPMIDRAPLRMSHSIKMPFSIHGKTGALALPVDGSCLSSLYQGNHLCHIRTLYEAHTKGRPVPPIFKRAIELFDAWVAQYDISSSVSKIGGGDGVSS